MTESKLTSLISRISPWLGVLAFSLCSTWAVYHWLAGQAAHPSALLWIPSVMVELVTAWAIGRVVGQVRELTRSRISKQDRRFHLVIFVVLLLVTAPMLAVSIVSNAAEYGSVLTGAVFPLASITCAIGAAIPTVEEKWRQSNAKKRQDEKTERQERDKEREQQRELAIYLASNDNLPATLEHYRVNPMSTQAETAQRLGVSRATVGNYVADLTEKGLMRRNGKGMEVLV